ncbi:DUF4189 domain-containing protein [Neisseria sp. Ec49-e6-T10]|uniref:DUF4189 domain-containing protein n=1 Tax=Neisseria sp. Ec49-e6-T10 TaxID=3140744 RepID=UPI003EB8EB1E
MKKLLLLLVLCSGLVYGQSPYSYGGESEQDRIAREHQSGGMYNPNPSNGSGRGSAQANVWGAIAIDHKTFQGTGSANSEKSSNDAKNRALALCKKRSNNCEVVLTYTWMNCGAVAVASDGDKIVWAAETKPFRVDAAEATLNSCRKKARAAGIKEDCVFWVPSRCALFEGA